MTAAPAPQAAVFRPRAKTRFVRRASISPDDIGHYLGFFGPVPWLLFVLYTLYLSYSAFVSGASTSHTAGGVAAYVTCLAALLLIVLSSPTPLPVWRTGTILAVIVFSTAAVTWQLPVELVDPGYATWEYNACDLLMFCLAIRGRIVAAWIGQALMQGVIALWSTLYTGSPGAGLATSYTQVFPLIACSVFAFGLHWTARQIVAHRTAERASAEEDARRDSIDRALHAELQAVRAMAVPVLEQIASGQRPPTRSVSALEAALRDRIRSPALVVEPLTTALRRAREAGVDVLVLDDVGGDVLSEAQRRATASWAAQRISEAAGDSVTLRRALSPAGPVVTVSVDGGAVSRFVL